MDINALLASPESKTLEFKRNLSSPEGVIRTVVAFANTAGGTIVIGVEDGTRRVRGVADPVLVAEQAANLISTLVAPRVVPEIEVCPWRKTYLVTPTSAGLGRNNAVLRAQRPPRDERDQFGQLMIGDHTSECSAARSLCDSPS
jgi:Putative DNA-binding domain